MQTVTTIGLDIAKSVFQTLPSLSIPWTLAPLELTANDEELTQPKGG
jgi:hypothetical protein